MVFSVRHTLAASAWSDDPTAKAGREREAFVPPPGGYFRRFMNATLHHLQQQMLVLLQPSVQPVTQECALHHQPYACALALLAMAGKLMQADGAMQDAERAALRVCFSLTVLEQEGVESVDSLLQEAAADTSDAALYARQFAAMTSDQPALREDAMRRLLQLALADGPLVRQEMQLLCAMAEAMHLSFERWDSLWQQIFPVPELPPRFYWWQAEQRRQWVAEAKRLQRAYHPDRWLSMNANPYGLLACKRLQQYVAGVNQLLHALN